MGNNASSASKTGTPASSSPTVSQTTPPAPAHGGPDSPRTTSRRDARAIIPPHTTQRSVVPPEASLAQAHGSTVVSRPKSLPSTAVSSLSGSPHSAGSPSAKAAAMEATTSRDEPTKPVDVPVESSPLGRSHPSAHASHTDSFLMSTNSITDMYLTRPPRLPLPIEEEVHTPGSPIIAPQEGQLDLDLDLEESFEGITRKSSGLSANTVDDDDDEELRVDKTRSVVPTRLEWKRGGDKVYVTGTIFQWNRKQRLHPV